MREKLASIEGCRATFCGVFRRYGSKPAFRGPPIRTVLLVDIRDEHGVEWCDHVWFVARKQWSALELKEGDQVKFSAVVKRYTKSYRGRREDENLPPVTEDFKLAFPMNVRKWGEPQAMEVLPLFDSKWTDLRQAVSGALTAG